MLEQARRQGTELIVDTVTGIQMVGDKVTGVTLGRGSISAPTVVMAAGPMAGDVARLAGVNLPLFFELHLKAGFRDHLGVIPREAPMIIWSDPQQIEWSPEERAELEKTGRSDLLGEMPVFCHGRPEGGPDSPYFVALWEYHKQVVDPVWPIAVDDLYPEVVMRGLTTMIPGLAAYHDRLPESVVDGGYYTKTTDNRPLIGPTGPQGVYVVAGLSGFGVMVASGAGDLVARHVVGSELPVYSDDFLPSRYDDPDYAADLALIDTGQL
jgi:glycine/D-amino acid oxidase-like deaminating enzyme